MARNIDERINFYYDPARQGYDTTLWKTTTGTPTVASNKIRLNAAKILGYGDLYKAETTFKINVPSAPVDAKLISGTAATAVVATWAAVSDGEFAITIDGTAYDVTAIDFSSVTTMPEVADAIQTAITTATSGSETCVWSAVLTGGTAATAVVATWEAVTDGEFAVTVDGTGVEVAGLDFSGVATMDEVAAIIQVGLRAATSGTETVVWSTDHFIITALNSVTVLSTVAAPAGTDISGAGATTFMDAETAVGTASNKFTITSTTSITVASAVSGGSGTDISGAGATTFMDAETAVGTATQGSDREFGLEQVSLNAKLSFKITGSKLTCECLYDGVSSSTEVDWETAWTATDTEFTIKWRGFDAEFIIGDYRRALINDTSVPKKALSQFIRNTSADNMDVAYIQTNNVQGYI